MAEVLLRPEGAPFQHAPPISRSTSSTSLSFDAYSVPRRTAYSLQDLRAPSLSPPHTSSLHSTPSSSLSLDTKSDESSSEDDSASFPEYGAAERHKRAVDSLDLGPTSIIESSNRPSSPVPSPAGGLSLDTPLSTPDPSSISEDDTAVRKEPSHYVDYLSYEWRGEDIWASWRHIVEHRDVYGEHSRLENASWRNWAKSQFKLRTVSPETLNWLKDMDVTWLYGPMQPASNHFCSQRNFEPVNRLSKTNSFLNGVKNPILKKRSISEVMLQKSLSSSVLVKQAAETVWVTLERRKPQPIISRAATDLPVSSIMSRTRSRELTDYFSSRATLGLHTPDQGEKKHIRFDDKVEQCIAVECNAVECKDADDDEDDCNYNPWAKYHDDDSSSDEDVAMMKRSRRKRPWPRTSSKTSISGDNKTIAKLPSTTLKCRTDSPDVTDQHPSHSLGFWHSSRLSPSTSQEPLRPSNPLTNFILSEVDEDDDQFEPSGAYGIRRSNTPTPSNYAHRPGTPLTRSESGGLRKIVSNMFMLFEDNEEEAQQPSIIRRVVDTANTVRDIIYVIWNVGWRN